MLWPEPTVRALPRRVTPFHYETVESFITRLAHANHIAPHDLRGHVAGTDSTRLERLASVSGYPVAVLGARLRGVTPDQNHATCQRIRSRPACHWCSVRRGAHEPVYCWFPDYVTVCHRHRRWVGPSAQTWADQADLTDHPAVLTTARRHKRLFAQHTPDAIDTALGDALRIVVRQRRIDGLPQGDIANFAGIPRWSTGRHVGTHLATYRQVIGLTGIIAALRPQLLYGADHQRVIADFLTLGTKAFGDPGSSIAEVLHDWLYDQTIIRNAIRAHRQQPNLVRRDSA